MGNRSVYVTEFARNNLLRLDGAMGTMLQQGHTAEQVYCAYVQAGANVIIANTFHHNSNEDIAREIAQAKATAQGNAFVALDIAPLDQMLAPLGTLGFEDAVKEYKRQVIAGANAGADLIYIETQTDLGHARAAVLAAKETCDLPVACTFSFEQNGRTFTGVSIAAMALTLENMGVDFIGLNCGVGPAQMLHMAEELLRWTTLPVICKPNAGLPRMENGQAIYDVDPTEFATQMAQLAALGVAGVGGCCGTTPAHIAALAGIQRSPRPATHMPNALCSAGTVIELTDNTDIAHIHGTDPDDLLEQAMDAQADVIALHCDDPVAMAEAVLQIQAMLRTPLQLFGSEQAIVAGQRVYHGKSA